MLSEKEIRAELEAHQDQGLTVEYNYLRDRDGMNYVRGYINALKFALGED